MVLSFILKLWNKLRVLIRGIVNKGFSGMRRAETRLKVRCNLIVNRPQSLTGQTAQMLATMQKQFV